MGGSPVRLNIHYMTFLAATCRAREQHDLIDLLRPLAFLTFPYVRVAGDGEGGVDPAVRVHVVGRNSLTEAVDGVADVLPVLNGKQIILQEAANMSAFASIPNLEVTRREQTMRMTKLTL